MSLHCNHANGGCGLPVEEITGKKCEKLAERIAGKRISSKPASALSTQGLVCDDIFAERSLIFISSYLFTNNSKWGESNTDVFVSLSPFCSPQFSLCFNILKMTIFPLPLFSPPPRENTFRWFVLRVSRTFFRWFLPPQASHNLHLHDCNAVTWFIHVKLVKILL